MSDNLENLVSGSPESSAHVERLIDSTPLIGGNFSEPEDNFSCFGDKYGYESIYTKCPELEVHDDGSDPSGDEYPNEKTDSSGDEFPNEEEKHPENEILEGDFMLAPNNGDSKDESLSFSSLFVISDLSRLGEFTSSSIEWITSWL